MTPEGQVKKACLEYLELHGIYAWPNNTGAARNDKGRLICFGKTGSSDIIGILPGGKFLAVECKSGSNTPTEEQKKFLGKIMAMGGCAILAWSVDDVEKGLDEFEELQKELQ